MKFKRMTLQQIGSSRRGLNAIIGSPGRVKRVQDGQDGVVCTFCRVNASPIVSENGNLHCSSCQAMLYDRKKDEVYALPKPRTRFLPRI
jgi:hypothetical protein